MSNLRALQEAQRLRDTRDNKMLPRGILFQVRDVAPQPLPPPPQPQPEPGGDDGRGGTNPTVVR